MAISTPQTYSLPRFFATYPGVHGFPSSGHPPVNQPSHGLQIEACGEAGAPEACEAADTVTVSMRVMSAGNGYQYLLRSVAAGDGNRSLTTPLTRYYAEAGTPPGRWLGSGLPELGGGRIRAGAEVSESQLALLIGMGRDPVTGDALGRAYPECRPLDERVHDRVVHLDPDLTATDENGDRAD
jgi:hypothetical protein